MLGVDAPTTSQGDVENRRADPHADSCAGLAKLLSTLLSLEMLTGAISCPKWRSSKQPEDEENKIWLLR